MLFRSGSLREPWLVRASLVNAETGMLFLLQLTPTGGQRAGERAAVSVEQLIERAPEPFVIVDPLGKATPVRISDFRFRAHDLLHAVDVNGDGIDDLATKASTEHAGATTLLALDLKARKANRFAAGFAWEDQ